MADEATIQDDNEAEKPKKDWNAHWTREIDLARKRLRKFHAQGTSAYNRYQGMFTTSNGDLEASWGFGGIPGHNLKPLNFFHTNISTLNSMLCGSKPKAEVSREHADPNDDVARVAATLFERMLEVGAEPSGYDLKDVLQKALLDRLVTGLGVARVRYSMETEEQPLPQIGMVQEVEPKEPQTIEVLSWEDADLEYVHWQDFLWGWCRTWTTLPWMGFRVWLTKEEATARFGGMKASTLQYKNQSPQGENETNSTLPREQTDSVKKAEIWEIWDKETNKVYWWSYGQQQILDEKDDPLELDGFFPTPKLMMANLQTELMTPVPDFMLSKDLYDEIDTLQTRISMITRAVKVVGVYDSSQEDIARMMNEGVENDMIPVDNWAMLADSNGLKGTIDWFPVETIVNTLKILMGVRDATIELLYQTTGLSDLLRGANTNPYVGEQTNAMTAKFGSVRIQALQDEFAWFASDLEALKVEVISKHFEQKSIITQANARFLPMADMPLVPQALMLMQSPDVKFRTEVRPESVAMTDYAQIQGERTQYLNTMATFIQSAQAMIGSVPGSAPMLISMMKWGMAGFKGADVLEGTMDRALDMAEQAAQNPQQDDGQAQAEKAKLQIEQLKLQGTQMKGQMELQKLQMKAQSDLANLRTKMQGELAKIQADSDADIKLENLEFMNELRKIEADLNADLTTIRANMTSSMAVEESQAAFDIASQNNDHQNNMVEIAAQRRNQNAGSQE